MTVIDTLSFTESFGPAKALLKEKYDSLAGEFKERFKDINDRIGSTEDEHVLQKLDAGLKFFKCMAGYMDQQNQFIEYFTRGLEQIDSTYWTGAINSQKLIDENAFLKATVATLQKREEVIMGGWRGDRRKWNQERLLKIKPEDVNR